MHLDENPTIDLNYALNATAHSPTNYPFILSTYESGALFYPGRPFTPAEAAIMANISEGTSNSG
jgi:hypothetical protein